MKDFKFLLEKYLDEKVEIAVHTAKMKQTYSDIIDQINGENQLDEICFNELTGLQKQLDESRFQANIGQSDFIPDVPVWKAKMMLVDAAELVLGLNEYQHLPKSFPLAREIYRNKD